MRGNETEYTPLRIDYEQCAHAALLHALERLVQRVGRTDDDRAYSAQVRHDVQGGVFDGHMGRVLLLRGAESDPRIDRPDRQWLKRARHGVSFNAAVGAACRRQAADVSSVSSL